MKISSLLLITCVIISICVAQPNDPSHILNGLFYDYNEALVRYGSLNLDIQEFNIISSLSINDVGNPLKGKYAVTPSAYDPNDDVVYMAAPNNENKTILSIINATTGSLLRTFNSLENYIVSLQYDIFQKQLFAHIETERENVTQVVEIDTNTGKLKQILGTISQAKPTHISSYCPICRKYFLIAQQDNHRIYIGVNSTDGGGISWQTPLDFFPTTMKFDYKTFTMYTVYVNQTTDNFLIGILNRTIGGIGKVVATITDDPNIFVTTPSAYDIAQNIFYSLTISTLPFNIGASYVNLNTSDGKVIPMPRNQYNPYAWFVKQFVH